MTLPRALIVSTVRGKTAEILQKMGAECMPCEENIPCFLWNIDNKYYSAQILLNAIEKPSENISLEGVEALILHHDPQADNATEDLEQWTSLITSLSEAEVLLFSCNAISDAPTRERAVDWCLQRKFELVEWIDPAESLEPDTDRNKYGIDRIIEALHAHVWPNAVLKGRVSIPEVETEMEEQVDEMEEQFENIQLTQDSSEKLKMESMLDGIMGGENADFGELFGQLMAMKEYAASLPTNQRRIAAEQLAIAFWKAMGGDPSEIED